MDCGDRFRNVSLRRPEPFQIPCSTLPFTDLLALEHGRNNEEDMTPSEKPLAPNRACSCWNDFQRLHEVSNEAERAAHS